VVVLSIYSLSRTSGGDNAGKFEESKVIKSRHEVDSLACRGQLNLIHCALQEYQKKKRELPEWLSDLTEGFLHDENVLGCPFIRHSGKVNEWRANLNVFPVFADPKSTTYGYELSSVEIPDVRGTTCREYKQRQMQVLGLGVPIVRCIAHERPVNLGYDGTIYKSGMFWEDVFKKDSSDEEVLHAPFLEETPLIAVRRLVRPRKTHIGSHCLDLYKYYNATLLHLTQIDYEGALIESLTNGVHQIGGVDFDVRGLVHLAGKDFPISFPEAIKGGISLARHSPEIHILHGTVGEVPPNSRTATILFNFENGGTERAEIIYGKDVETRWFDPETEPERKKSKPAWTSPANPQASKSLRLYVKTWKNPQPEVKVESIEFVSEMNLSAPFLVAITAE
jgi:hypothetical protein